MLSKALSGKLEVFVETGLTHLCSLLKIYTLYSARVVSASILLSELSATKLKPRHHGSLDLDMTFSYVFKS